MLGKEKPSRLPSPGANAGPPAMRKRDRVKYVVGWLASKAGLRCLALTSVPISSSRAAQPAPDANLHSNGSLAPVTASGSTGPQKGIQVVQSISYQPTNLVHPASATPAISIGDPPLSCGEEFLKEALSQLSDAQRAIIENSTTTDITSTIDDTIQEAKRRGEEWQAKSWPGRELVNDIVTWLDKFKSVGDIAVNADPVHAGLPWAGIRLLLQVVVSDQAHMKALADGIVLVLRLAKRLQIYFEFYSALPPASLTTINLRQHLIPFYSRILNFLAHAISTFTKDTALRVLQALWQRQDLVNFQQEMNEAATQLDIEVENCHRDLSSRERSDAASRKQDLDAKLLQLKELQPMRELLQKSTMQADLSRLNVVDEAFYDSYVEEALPHCLSGTRLRLLEQIKQWAVAPDSKLIFWLCGMAGTGKSTISRTVARMFDKDFHILGGSFFFKRSEANRNNAKAFFPTIAKQIADRIPMLRPHIAAALEQDSFLVSKGLDEQFDKLLAKPLMACYPSDETMAEKNLVIVIDALDECDRQTNISTFIRLLSQLSPFPGIQLRIFITSRPDLPIRIGFANTDGCHHEDVILEEAQEATIEQDIRCFFDYEFSRIRAKWAAQGAPIADPNWPSKVEVDALVNMAKPLFIFASTVCRHLLWANPIERLTTILQQPSHLGRSKLAQIYLPVLNESLAHEDGDGNRENYEDVSERDERLRLFRNIVGPIVTAADPLSVVALSSLLEVDTYTISQVLGHLHSVLTVPKLDKDVVRLLHLSFRDFLLDNDNAGIFSIDETNAHDSMARQCLKLLSKPNTLVYDICRVYKPATRRTAVAEQTIQERIPADVAYACTHWAKHVVLCGRELDDHGDVYVFLTHHFTNWLEAMSWLGNMCDVIVLLDDLLSICKSDANIELATFLHDAVRFVLANRDLVDLAPLQLHYSAIPFAPSQSVVHTLFAGRAPVVVKKHPLGVSATWDAKITRLEIDCATRMVISSDGSTLAAVRWWEEDIFILNIHTLEMTRVEVELPLLLYPDSEPKPVLSFASTDGGLIAISEKNFQISLWNTRNGLKVGSCIGHDGSVLQIVSSPDGSMLASASKDSTVRIWNMPSGEIHEILRLEDDEVLQVIMMSKKRVVALLISGTLQLWDADKGAALYSIRTGEDVVVRFCFSPDGSHIAIALHDNTIMAWDVEAIRCTAVLGPAQRASDLVLEVLMWSSQGTSIIFGQASLLRRWHPGIDDKISFLKSRKPGLMSHWACSPAGIFARFSDRPDALELFDLRDEYFTPPSTTTEDCASLRDIALSCQGILAQTYPRRHPDHVRLVNCGKPDSTDIVFKNHKAVEALRFSPDGRILALLLSGFSIDLIDVESPADAVVTLNFPTTNSGSMRDFLFASDGTLLACMMNEGLLLWETQSGKYLRLVEYPLGLPSLLGPQYSITLTPCGGMLVFYDGKEMWSFNTFTGDGTKGTRDTSGCV